MKWVFGILGLLAGYVGSQFFSQEKALQEEEAKAPTCTFPYGPSRALTPCGCGKCADYAFTLKAAMRKAEVQLGQKLKEVDRGEKLIRDQAWLRARKEELERKADYNNVAVGGSGGGGSLKPWVDTCAQCKGPLIDCNNLVSPAICGKCFAEAMKAASK